MNAENRGHCLVKQCLKNDMTHKHATLMTALVRVQSYQGVSHTDDMTTQSTSRQSKHCHARPQVTHTSAHSCDYPSAVSPRGSGVPRVHPQHIQHVTEIQPNCPDLQQNLPPLGWGRRLKAVGAGMALLGSSLGISAIPACSLCP